MYINLQKFPIKNQNTTEWSFKPWKAGTKTAHVVFILDYSSSMNSVREATISGFNEFLEGQKQSKVPTSISLYGFDGNSVNLIIDKTDAKSVEPLNEATYRPKGMTNLYDAIGMTMVKINNQLAPLKKSARDSITIVILTDGAENASRSYSSVYIKSMIELAEGKDWSFMFLGANIDAFAVGAQFGMRHDNTLQYNTSNMGNTMAAATRMAADLSMLKGGGLSASDAYVNAAFKDDERKDAQ